MRPYIKVKRKDNLKIFDDDSYSLISMAVLGFNFPPDSGEKVTLEITVLMSLTMFMNMVNTRKTLTLHSIPLHYGKL